MNKTIVIASAILAVGTALAAVIMNRRARAKQVPQTAPQNTRHITDVFSRAKLG